MARLIDDLLSLSRIEQKQHVRPEAAVDLARSRVTSPTHCADGAGDGGQTQDEHGTAGHRDRCRDELVRVAENLIENAIKYGARATRRGGDRVEVSVARTAKEGALAVRDFGRGIPPEHLPRLTERFYRVDAGRAALRTAPASGWRS